MIKQLVINGKKSYDDFDVLIASRKISTPKKKSIKETVPFSNKVYDFSKLDGELYWEERTLEYSFDIAELSTEEMEIVKSKLQRWLLNVHDADIFDPYIGDYHFHGSYDSDSWNEDFGAGTITVKFSVYPYKISNSDKNNIEYIGESDDGTLENSVLGVVQGMTIYGKSSQKTTKGNQLIDFNDGASTTGTTTTFENDILTLVGDGSLPYQNYGMTITDIIKNNPNKELYFDYEKLETVNEMDGTIVQLNIVKTDDSREYMHLINKTGGQYGYSIPSDTSIIKSVGLHIYTTNNSGSEPTANTVKMTKPMLQFGRDKLEYEKYTGGIPSPNLNYPSEVESIEKLTIYTKNASLVSFDDLKNSNSGVTSTFVNDILTVKSSGLTGYESAGKDITGIVKYNQGKKLYFDFEKMEFANTPLGVVVQLNFAHNNGKDSYITLVSASKTQSYYTIPKDTSNIKSVHLQIYPNNHVSYKANTITITKPRLQFGTDKLEYVLNEFDTKTISIPPSNSIGDYTDTIEKINDRWKFVKRINAIILNGSENWGSFYAQSNGNGRAVLEIKDLIKSVEPFISDKLTYIAWSSNPWTSTNYVMSRETTNKHLYVYLKNITTLDEFKATLSENPITIYYVLETPEYIDLPDETQAILNNIKTYAGITNVFLSEQTTFSVNYNELKNVIINNNSAHRIMPTIKSTGKFTIKHGNSTYSIGEGTYTDTFYLESGENELTLIGHGEITFSYIEEVF